MHPRHLFAYALLPLLLASVSLPAAAQPAPSLAPVIAEVNRHQLPQQALSVALLPLNGPGSASFHNADGIVNPGSVMKVVTTYAALELLGPDYTWHTRLYTDGTLSGDTLNGDLYFVASGDPKLSEERLWLLLRELRGYGIRQITGNLMLDGSVFHIPHGLRHFDDDGNDPSRPFLVEPHGLLTNLNVVRVRARADQRGVHTWIEPPLHGVTLDNQLTRQGGGSCPTRRQLGYQPIPQPDGGTLLRLSGNLPQGCSVDNYLSFLPHAEYTGRLLRALWESLGGSLSGSHRLGQLPERSTLLATSSSSDLASMVRDINKWSNNVMSRQLFLQLGANHRTPQDRDDIAAAKRVIRDWLREKGIEGETLVFDNGSGLSRIERITARQMALLLQQAWHSPYAAELTSSLPLVAMDGTMRRRLRGTELRGEGRIKTGTLNSVRAIAGYARDEQNTTWAVVGIVNHPQAARLESALDVVLQQVRLAPRNRSIATAAR